MSICGQHHRELNEHGVGKCSCPMFTYDGPAGFCDRPAYGNRPDSPQYRNYSNNEMQREDGRYNGYVPGLACTWHGGPGPKFERDGNMWCATTSTFVNLQESWAGFGETKEQAEADLLANIAREATLTAALTEREDG